MTSTAIPSKTAASEAADIQIGCPGSDLRDLQRLGVDRVGDLFGRRPAIGGVEFDAEIAIRPARIVARRQDQPAERLVLADDAGGGGGGEDAARANQEAAEAVAAAMRIAVWIACALNSARRRR